MHELTMNWAKEKIEKIEVQYIWDLHIMLLIQNYRISFKKNLITLY